VSPALVVGLIALVLAATGGAIASTDSLKRGVTKSDVRAIAKKAVSKRAPIYARVDADGTVDAESSRGIAQANVATGSFPGYYCFSGLPFEPRNGSATVDWNTSIEDLITTVGIGANANCPTGTEFFVDMRSPEGTGSVAGGFFVTIYP